VPTQALNIIAGVASALNASDIGPVWIFLPLKRSGIYRCHFLINAERTKFKLMELHNN
jgi:hypothetical protein